MLVCGVCVRLYVICVYGVYVCVWCICVYGVCVYGVWMYVYSVCVYGLCVQYMCVYGVCVENLVFGVTVLGTEAKQKFLRLIGSYLCLWHLSFS